VKHPTRGTAVQDLTMEVRGHEFDVTVERGHFQAVHDGNQLSDTTWEGLRDQLMRATKVAAAKIAIDFVTMAGGKPERGIVTGQHAANRNLLVEWPERASGGRHRNKEQLASYNLNPALRPLSADELSEWVRLSGEARDARDALSAWEGERKIDLRKAVGEALDSAVRGMA